MLSKHVARSAGTYLSGLAARFIETIRSINLARLLITFLVYGYSSLVNIGSLKKDSSLPFFVSITTYSLWLAPNHWVTARRMARIESVGVTKRIARIILMGVTNFLARTIQMGCSYHAARLAPSCLSKLLARLHIMVD